MQLAPTRATVALVAITSAAFVLVTLGGQLEWMAQAAGFIPARASGTLEVAGAVPVWATPLTATLIHAGFVHLLFNMMMLAFCGRLVELAIGPAGLTLLYLVGAYAAALAQFVAGPLEQAPMVGASGAASALLGAYALLYGRPRAAVSHPGLNRAINALWLLAAWVGIQFLFGYAAARGGLPIAIAAHIGGFIAGLVLTRPLLLWRYRRA